MKESDPIQPNALVAEPAAQETEPSHKELIEASWYRCESFGLSHSTTPDFGSVPTGHVSALMDEHQDLVRTTENEVLPYYENILTNSSCVIVLADRQGHVLNTWGSNRFRSRNEHGLVPGHRWQESGVGTNAIGTALATGQAIQVNRDEHFLRANRFMVGAASPIFDTHKQLVGVLDISSDAYLPQDHTLGMVKLMSLTVENQLIYAAFEREHYILAFNTNISSLESHWSGLVVLDENGTIVSANRRASALLAHDLALLNVEAVFGCTMREIRQQPASMPLSLRVLERFRVWVKVNPPIAPKITVPDFRQQPDYQAPRTVSALPPDVIPYAELEHGDAQVRQILNQARKIIEKDIPILIRGETGSGKEILVRSLHYHSSRRGENLVAVNCASIPTELVESELFGYEKGAFTGAHTKGSIGLIRRAHKGTLFLDEIGEMPLHVQSRLLRVLQERVVTPLGSSEVFPVDIKLISATNRNLKAEVEQGNFRQDLYYRISGLSLELPALRERLDKEALILYIYSRLKEPTDPELPFPVRHLLFRHPWPGNMRQLVNVLKVALAMADGAPLSTDDLPADFYDDLAPEDNPVSPAPSSSTAHLSDTPSSQAQPTDLSVLIPQLYAANGRNISRTAKAAGVSRNTVYKYLRA
ncbi:sigma-54-dependent Fis family transcriptional regulator [Salinispirillum marinum]|uniref:Sigma-54-dependent Fis family transcriptional regulator n=2 Tax=Saccharospirillaceae TaxID=255527 RepID=A0ABV8BHR7_9GAMM